MEAIQPTLPPVLRARPNLGRIGFCISLVGPVVILLMAILQPG